MGRLPPAWPHIYCQKALCWLVEAPCLGCGLPGSDPLCARCFEQRDPLPSAHCPICLGSLDAHRACALCRRGPVPFSGVSSLGRYSGSLRRVIRALKYQSRADLGLYLGRAIAALPAIDSRERLVVPLPVHASRRVERGYNQVEPIAWQIARSLGLSYDARALRREGASRPFYAEGRARRWELAREAFRADPLRVRGRAVLLVDDIMTSGATLWAAASALGEQGACDVRIAIAARTSLHEPGDDARHSGMSRGHKRDPRIAEG